MRSLIILYSILILSISSCDIINPSEEIPAYLEVNPFTFTAQVDQGTQESEIRDVWIILNNNTLGVFELPLKLPVLDLGEGTLTLYPGIRENGINNNPQINPFMKPFEIDVNFVEMETVLVNPVTSYELDVQFRTIDDFEGSTQLNLEEDGNDSSKVLITLDNPFEGGGSGIISLNDSVPILETGLNILFSDLPTTGQPVYLEVHFKGNVDFNFGLKRYKGINIPSKDFFLGIRSEEDVWKKIYINLRDPLAKGDFDSYQILLAAVHDQANGDESLLFLDNLKIMHY